MNGLKQLLCSKSEQFGPPLFKNIADLCRVIAGPDNKRRERTIAATISLTETQQRPLSRDTAALIEKAIEDRAIELGRPVDPIRNAFKKYYAGEIRPDPSIRGVTCAVGEVCLQISKSPSPSLLVVEVYDYNPFESAYRNLMNKIVEMLSEKVRLAIVTPCCLTSDDFHSSSLRCWWERMLRGIPRELHDRLQIYSLREALTLDQTPFVTRFSYSIDLESGISLNQMFFWLPGGTEDALILMVKDAGDQIVCRYPFLDSWFTTRRLPLTASGVWKAGI